MYSREMQASWSFVRRREQLTCLAPLRESQTTNLKYQESSGLDSRKYKIIRKRCIESNALGKSSGSFAVVGSRLIPSGP